MTRARRAESLAEDLNTCCDTRVFMKSGRTMTIEEEAHARDIGSLTAHQTARLKLAAATTPRTRIATNGNRLPRRRLSRVQPTLERVHVNVDVFRIASHPVGLAPRVGCVIFDLSIDRGAGTRALRETVAALTARRTGSEHLDFDPPAATVVAIDMPTCWPPQARLSGCARGYPMK